MPESKPTNCVKCGRPKQQEGKGTITQWIALCRCDQQFQTTGTDEETALEVCPRCRKRIAIGRSGSFTQWIFRSDLCSCEFGISSRKESSGKPGDTVTGGKEETEEDEEFELPLDPSGFPMDRYKPIAEIGEGASGLVYLCRDRLLNKKVAIKCLRAVTAEQLVAFQQEAKATSLLHHAGVVAVLDFGSTGGGAPYMVMEYVKGISLDKYLKENGPQSVPQTAFVFAQVADALAHAHGKGIFHRDMKTSNILIVGDNKDCPEVRIIDFGVAAIKHATQEPTFVGARTLVGTPVYMAPDQARGLPYGAASEIYSVGCVIFETLTGRPPFIGDTALETINMHAQKAPPALSDLRNDIEIPERLEAIVATCLSKDPHDRFHSMSDLNNALMSLIERGEYRQTEELVEPEKPPPPVKRYLRPGSLVAIAVVLALSLTYSSTLFKTQSVKNNKTEGKQPVLSAPLAELFTIDTRANTCRAVGLVTDSDLEWLARNHRDGFDTLYLDDVTVKPTTRLSHRGWAALAPMRIRYLQVTNSSVSDEDLVPISKIKALHALFANSTLITDKGVQALENTKLYTLNLNFTGVTDSSTGSIARIKGLRQVALGGTRITDAGLAKLSRLPLTYLDIRDCDSITDEGMRYVGSMKKLGTLLLSTTNISAKGFQHLELPNLEILCFPGAKRIDDECMRLMVQNCPKIYHLNADDTQITGKGIEYISRLPRLHRLFLGNCSLTDDELEPIFKTRVSILNLSMNPITDRTIERLLAMRTLKGVELLHCTGISKAAHAKLDKSQIDSVHLNTDTDGGAARELIQEFFSD